MRSIITWILILHACHFPVLFPDLDGECRGTPTASWGELNAWHVVMIGVRPNDDIDRGPIRTGREPENGDEHLHPLGAPATVTARTQTRQLCTALNLSPSRSIDRLGELVVQTAERPEFEKRCHCAVPDSRGVCISFCSWQV